jgi:hypothetical protein
MGNIFPVLQLFMKLLVHKNVPIPTCTCLEGTHTHSNISNYSEYNFPLKGDYYK